jgi:hypothetical protein
VQRREAGPCIRALSDYCGPCASYEERLFAVDRHPKKVTTGTCGDLRVVHSRSPFEGADEFYDREGRLVGARDWVDFPRPCFTGGRDHVYQYGVVPASCP